MKKELDQNLFEKYPALFRRRNKDDFETCMYYGFSCGDGWYKIIDELSEKLSDFILEYYAFSKGAPVPYVVQVKEKFGSLCFYMSNQTKEMTEMIAIAEEQSVVTCEWCGEPGKHDRHREKKEKFGWVRTLCDPCAEKRDGGYRPWAAQET